MSVNGGGGTPLPLEEKDTDSMEPTVAAPPAAAPPAAAPPAAAPPAAAPPAAAPPAAAAPAAVPVGRSSAPSSPCVSRKPPQTLSIDSSRIPQPLASPTPLRRSGSLRVRGERPGSGFSSFSHSRTAPGSGRNGFGLGARISPGAAFPSITEAAESWKKSLRGVGDGLASHGEPPPPPPGSTLSSSNLRQQRHHRSLQSLVSRTSSRDSYPHTPTPSPEDLELLRPQNLNRFLLDHAKEFTGDHDDLDSLRSYGSNCSTQSACDHSQFARNGTTFSGRRMKYIVHCSSHPEPNEYLTPTQRANQQIRRLKALVEQARKDLEAKDENIFKLTKEVVELRLLRDEVDSSPVNSTPVKRAVNSEDSPACRVASQLENEYGNSTSLSDSGHFDDVLSLTSAQSTHSPGPRQHIPSPESDRLAEMYQRKIDDVTRKQGEKSVEDRKSLVDTYEKKMEDMSRKSSEKFQQEKNDLIEMYEKKIGDIVRRHQERLAEERTMIQESCERKLEALSQKIGNQNSQDESVQVLTKSLEEAQQVLEITEEKSASLIQQLDDLNLRHNDVQHELFQSREKTVLLEEEVESLQQAITAQEQQLSEKETALVQMARLESEVQILQRHLEEQKDALEQKSQLENELARVLSKLNEAQQKYKDLECKMVEAEETHEMQSKEASELKLKLDVELANVLDSLLTSEKKISELEHEKMVKEEEVIELRQTNAHYENEIRQLSATLRDEKHKSNELEKSKADIEALYKEEQRLRSHLDDNCKNKSKSLEEEIQKNMLLESKSLNFVALEQEYKNTKELAVQLQRELACVKLQCLEMEKKNEDLQSDHVESQNLQDQISRYMQQVKTLSEHSEKLQKEVEELRSSLAEEKSDVQMVLKRKIQDMEDKLTQSHDRAEEHLQQVQSLTQSLADAEIQIKMLSSSLAEEKSHNKELLHWKQKAEMLEIKMKSFEEDLIEKNNQLQCVASIENEVEVLKHKLKLENEKVQELLPWKSKASHLEEELKSLKEEITEQIEKMHLVNELSESINRDVNSLKLPSTQSTRAESMHDIQQQRILELETEIAKLQGSLDQSSWALSEKEISTLEMQKKLTEQTLKLQTFEDEITALNRCVSELKEENEKLMAFSNQLHLKNVVEACTDQPYIDVSSEETLTHCGDSCIAPSNGEKAVDIISQLKAEIESLRKALADQETKHTDMNLKMYLKGQEAAKFERKDQVLEMAAQAPEKVSVPELLTQLAETEKELEKVKAMYRQLAEGQANSSSSPEATLLFLKSAFYYFLTDESNCQGHLHAIQSILGFTEAEKQSIDTLTYIRR